MPAHLNSVTHGPMENWALAMLSIDRNDYLLFGKWKRKEQQTKLLMTLRAILSNFLHSSFFTRSWEFNRAFTYWHLSSAVHQWLCPNSDSASWANVLWNWSMNMAMINHRYQFHHLCWLHLMHSMHSYCVNYCRSHHLSTGFYWLMSCRVRHGHCKPSMFCKIRNDFHWNVLEHRTNCEIVAEETYRMLEELFLKRLENDVFNESFWSDSSSVSCCMSGDM